ncbi:hypothetical protein DENSPDRAFT_874887 [Dentipellis sp. KUC8613]|nr:hypothetical protein DENSPDRAFT_874887 [Dentipellis sp. KUC8613]
MATPNSSPGPTTSSTDASPVVVRRRPKERPKGSLPIYSRPGAYRRPNPKRAVPTTYPVKGKTRSKGAEGLLSCQSDDEDDTELLNRSKALRHELCEGAQRILDWRDFEEGANQLQQELKDVMENADKDSERVQGIVREELGKIDKIKKRLAEMYEESDRKAIEYRRLSKAQDQQLHEAQVEYREARRANRRAGLR